MAHLETLPHAFDAPAQRDSCLPDLSGENYMAVLGRLHRVLQPRTYIEIGVLHGVTLALSRCASVAIDPNFQFHDTSVLKDVLNKPSISFYQMPSDDFFLRHDPTAILGGPIEMAFLDGMHRCEFLLRDFINVEKRCHENSLIMLHDCLPTEEPMTHRDQEAVSGASPHRRNWWTGDVWRTALLLKRRRPDLSITAIDAEPTGLVMITGLDPDNRDLACRYAVHVQDMMTWSLAKIGLRDFYDELQVEPASSVGSDEQIKSRYYLHPL